MKLTADTLKGRKTVGAIHIDFSRSKSAWIYGVEGVPRLKVQDLTDGRTRAMTYLVDDKPMPNLAAALAVLNCEKTLEEVMAQPEPPPAPVKKVSLPAQIEEVEYELKQRKDVYERIAKSNPRKRSELELHTTRMEGVLATLQWLFENEAAIKQRMYGNVDVYPEASQPCPDLDRAQGDAHSEAQPNGQGPG